MTMRRFLLAMVLLALPAAAHAQCAGGSCAIPQRGYTYGYRYLVPQRRVYVQPVRPRLLRRSAAPPVYDFDPTPGYIWVWSPVGWRLVRTR